MTFLSIGVAGYAMFHAATGLRFLPIENPMLAPWGLGVHVAASGVALLMGPFQFLPGLRGQHPKLHRWMGRIYIAACAVGGTAGVTIALSSTAGLVSWCLVSFGSCSPASPGQRPCAAISPPTSAG
jgi:hypothetical protein